MGVWTRYRRGLVSLALLGIAPVWVVPAVVDPEHFLEHDARPELAAEHDHVVLHHGDGDHDHEAPRLEHGERSWHEACELCALLGKSSADRAPRLPLVPQGAVRPPPPRLAPWTGESLRRGPSQPRAPPRAPSSHVLAS